MPRFFIITLILFLLGWIIIAYIRRALAGFLQSLNKGVDSQRSKKDEKEDILYQKDNVVVLKGDANKENDDKFKK